MRPAGANVYHSYHVMRLPEKLMPGQLDHTPQAENEQECQKCHGDNSPKNVWLLDELLVHCRLWLVEVAFNDRPAKRVDKRLDVNNSAKPSVEEVERLVRDAGDETEDRFSRRKHYDQGSESVC